MEPLRFIPNGAARFDQLMEENRTEGLPECGDLEIVVKPGGMQSGRSCVMVSFTVDDNGKKRRVQAVTTLALLAMIAPALKAIKEGEDAALAGKKPVGDLH